MEHKEKVEKQIDIIAGGDPSSKQGDPKTGIPAGSKQRALYNTEDQGRAYLGDMINFSLASGGANPMATKQGRLMFQLARELHGDKAAHDLMDQVVIFNQRPDQKKKSNEDKISSFYEIIHGSPELESLKSKVGAIGYGPVSTYLSSPDVDVQETQKGNTVAMK